MKCWDLEYNKVIRHYHGHLSAVQDLSIHPTLDILVTCARDATARVRSSAYLFRSREARAFFSRRLFYFISKHFKSTLKRMCSQLDE